MEDDVGIIEHLPGAADTAVDGARTQLIIAAQSIGNFGGDGAEVGLVGAGDDDKIIGDGGDFAHVENDSILGFFIFGQFAAKKRQFLRIHFAGMLQGMGQR